MGHTTKLILGKNDLQSVNPSLATEWHPTKNGELLPSMVTAHSKKKVWWLGTCGHEWPAEIDSRAIGRGCPYCSGRLVLEGFNDLATKAPKLVIEWDAKSNLPLTPQSVSPGSHKKVWWICNDCGHKWPAEIKSRVAGEGCPQCGRKTMGNTFRKNIIESGAKTLADEHPELALEWHPTRNTPFTPSDYTSHSSAMIVWHCGKCGHDWEATINNRVGRGSGCPVCAGNVIKSGYNDLATLNPDLAAEWHPTKNLPLTVQTVGASSNKNVWWICRFGHEYKCRVIDRKKGVGCSECSKRFQTSMAEQTIRYYIEQHFDKVLSSYRPDYLDGTELDIFIPDLQIGIEYDGQRYHNRVSRDQKKDALCTRNGITLIRIREPKCPVIERNDPTIILQDLSDDSLSAAIKELLTIVRVEPTYEVNITKDKQSIISFFRNTALGGSIEEVFPSLAEEWDYTLNGEILPSHIPATYSKDKYYWKCKSCGYSWPASLGERIRGSGCPACAGKVIIPGINDLATTHKDLAAEWHPTRNGSITPQMVSKGSDDKIWWKCPKCGYEWQAKIKKRVAGSGCEKCAHEEWGQKQYKAVYQFAPTGEYITSFPTARIAAEQVGISRGAIQSVCRGTGKNKTAGGYIWSYEKDGILKEKTLTSKSNKTKCVLQYSTDQQFIKKFQNIKEAASEVGISEVSIRHACNGTAGRKTAGGFIWRYAIE